MTEYKYISKNIAQRLLCLNSNVSLKPRTCLLKKLAESFDLLWDRKASQMEIRNIQLKLLHEIYA